MKWKISIKLNRIDAIHPADNKTTENAFTIMQFTHRLHRIAVFQQQLHLLSHFSFSSSMMCECRVNVCRQLVTTSISETSEKKNQQKQTQASDPKKCFMDAYGRRNSSWENIHTAAAAATVTVAHVARQTNCCN